MPKETDKTATGRPKQKRSIETRRKILEAGSALVIKRGLHNVTTDDIAKAAGVSTGIVYHYFKDKHDIVVTAMNEFGTEFFGKILDIYKPGEGANEIEDFEVFINRVFDMLLEYHKREWESHEAISALYHSDKEIAEVVDVFWVKVYDKAAELLLVHGAKAEHLNENVRLALDNIESYCHTYMSPIRDDLDFEYMRRKVIEHVKELLF